jgi:hypothetical protein
MFFLHHPKRIKKSRPLEKSKNIIDCWIKIEKLYSTLNSEKENLKLKTSGILETSLAYEIKEKVNSYTSKIEFYERKREGSYLKFHF